jgi:hypothetical protein
MPKRKMEPAPPEIQERTERLNNSLGIQDLPIQNQEQAIELLTPALSEIRFFEQNAEQIAEITYNAIQNNDLETIHAITRLVELSRMPLNDAQENLLAGAAMDLAEGNYSAFQGAMLTASALNSEIVRAATSSSIMMLSLPTFILNNPFPNS